MIESNRVAFDANTELIIEYANTLIDSLPSALSYDVIRYHVLSFVCLVVIVWLVIRSDGLKEVSKSYKRALLKIHPDKHMDNESKHLRATEVFKYVSQAFNEYKKKHEPV